MSNDANMPRGLNRRDILKGGAALGAAGLAGLPLVGSAYAQGKTLNFWNFYAPDSEQPKAQVEWWTKMAADWNAANDTKVELDYLVDYMQGNKLSTAFASGQGPDLFLISPGDFLRYYNGGALLDLTPFIDPEVQKDFPEAVMGTRKVDGKIYGVPMEVEPMAFYYSVKAFEDAGLNENDVPKTWDELLELGKKLTTSDRYGLLFDTNPGYYQNFTWYPFMWQGGGEFQTADGKSGFNSPAVIAALKLWKDAIDSGSAPRQINAGGFDIVANMGAGYCAMQNCGIWGIAAMEQKAPDVPFGMFKLPIPAGGKYVTVGGGWAFVANAKGKDPETAGKFIAWALASKSPDSVQRIVDWCTVAKSDMPPRQSAIEAGKAAYGQGGLKFFADEVYPGARGEPRLPPEAYKIISDAIQAAMLGGVEPEKAAADASALLDTFLASYKGAPML
ncbi:MAG: sugar ABC transporter substrate-binding protein [Devosia sp. 67-54]|uniref:ABC transporter substrate-binding protein n=1 Tax=unclassified Devosia TaxID=196773 RepID=UPI0009696D12|nr:MULTISPECIES: sugar ABC transporter substrate-binding protein [unclassified Devosia]MBN9307449.1 sugar ABC transporter substrate-binding protein [Devosia sp.]OJX16831.1 MAG: sugar ABC transporter substrate-binding protein [Devosia sp. 67-54]